MRTDGRLFAVIHHRVYSRVRKIRIQQIYAVCKIYRGNLLLFVKRVQIIRRGQCEHRSRSDAYEPDFHHIFTADTEIGRLHFQPFRDESLGQVIGQSALALSDSVDVLIAHLCRRIDFGSDVTVGIVGKVFVMENADIKTGAVPHIRQIVTQIVQNGFRITRSHVGIVKRGIQRQSGFFGVVAKSVEYHHRRAVPEIRSHPFEGKRVIGKSRRALDLGGYFDNVISVNGSSIVVFYARSQGERTRCRDRKRDYR